MPGLFNEALHNFYYAMGLQTLITYYPFKVLKISLVATHVLWLAIETAAARALFRVGISTLSRLSNVIYARVRRSPFSCLLLYS